MLRLYCQALAGRNIELHDLSQLLEKEIGWSRTDVATTIWNLAALNSNTAVLPLDSTISGQS
jgi:hypothetical protein